ncbi:MAG: efflux RND transporter periplasmic adaptor subunit [Tannerellaceae bacterium]|jgi:Cu(I)/Ag(I) efflux system membrane fusion protein|nr:efflux RND transporter periplasmic adaptor subunit [Tannerellaceae bacterium]
MNTRNTLILGLALGLALGFFAGGWFLRRGANPHHEPFHTEADHQVWTCSMHPQIRQPQAGKCPLCGMDLIPLTIDSPDVTETSAGVTLSREALALADIRTFKVQRRLPVREVSLYGSIQADERRVRLLTAHTSGRVDTLFVAFAGEHVRRGQKIASLYSPELLNAQQELREAGRIGSAPLLEASREKLRLLGLTDSQVVAMETSEPTNPGVEVLSPAEGTVTRAVASQGDYVRAGSILLEVTDLSSVWAVFEAYEEDLLWLHRGDAIRFSLQALPGRSYAGRIAFIDPVVDATTRTAKVRVETPNKDGLLKPGMYVSALARASHQDGEPALIVPKTAVLWTGKRSIVYVRQPAEDPVVFAMREVELGPSLGDSLVLLAGLAEGEEVVVRGTFVVDAAAQLEGKPSMMNNEASLAPLASSQLRVEGLCSMCKERIEAAAQRVAGLQSASWDVTTRQLHITFDPSRISPKDIARAVAEAGHDTQEFKADEAVYRNLPDCCKYRKAD